MTDEDIIPEELKGVGSGPPDDLSEWKLKFRTEIPNGKTGKVYFCDANFPALRVVIDKEAFAEYEKIEYIIISDNERSLLFKFESQSIIKTEEVQEDEAPEKEGKELEK